MRVCWVRSAWILFDVRVVGVDGCADVVDVVVVEFVVVGVGEHDCQYCFFYDVRCGHDVGVGALV